MNNLAIACKFHSHMANMLKAPTLHTRCHPLNLDRSHSNYVHAAFASNLTSKKGRLKQHNFHNFLLLRFFFFNRLPSLCTKHAKIDRIFLSCWVAAWLEERAGLFTASQSWYVASNLYVYCSFSCHCFFCPII